MTNSISPTDEQLHVLDLLASTEDNIAVRSLAGTGKTTMLHLMEQATKGPTLCLAFNKSVAEEMEEKFSSTTTVRTFNGLGHRVWGNVVPGRLTVDFKNKTKNIFKSLVDDLPKPYQQEAWDSYMEIISAVALAKNLGYIPNGHQNSHKRLIEPEAFFSSLEERPDELTCEIIDKILLVSIKQAYSGLIDFNDQLYMPALFGGSFPRFPTVLVDEAQDLNPINHFMLEKLCKVSRLCVVGDPNQSIYAFRGAVQGGMASLRKEFNMTECALTVSFRCPRRIVEYAQRRVPDFRWNMDGGSVTTFNGEGHNFRDIPDTATIISRNNAPLFGLALNLLAHRRSVSVAGTDIGPKLVSTMRKLGELDLSQGAVLAAIQQWLDQKAARGSTTASDMAACMKVFALSGNNLAQAVAMAEHVFAQKGSIRLLTGHKAKGLEFPIVYHLDPWLIGEHEQDQNLWYVITTRSQDQLIELNTSDIRWQ